jgi:signal transduction histidine kinase
MAGRSIRQELIGLCSESSRVLGFEPVIRFDGPIDAAVDDSLADELLAVLREALTNVSKHAKASSAEVSVEARDSMLTARVTDNGVGYRGDSATGRGVVNLRVRATRLDGDFEIAEMSSGGTMLTWRVPLKRGDDLT